MAGQNDFLIFDENMDNILTASDYSDDEDRLNGFQSGLARSNITNKVLHQTSMMCNAIGELVSDAGLTATDESTVDSLKNVLTEVFTTTEWGGITGTLSDQEDLQEVLDAKQDTLTAGDGIIITDNIISSEDFTDNVADRDLSNLTDTGENKLNYNVFCINTGEVTDAGEPAFLSVVTTETTEDDETVTTSVLTTAGEFDVTTAAGKTYTISDTLTLDITDYEEGTYNVYVNPVDLSLSVLDNTITSGITFPDDAADGDYLLNTAKVPYDLQKYVVTENAVNTVEVEYSSNSDDVTITSVTVDADKFAELVSNTEGTYTLYYDFTIGDWLDDVFTSSEIADCISFGYEGEGDLVVFTITVTLAVTTETSTTITTGLYEVYAGTLVIE